jgi:hypothetical protein
MRDFITEFLQDPLAQSAIQVGCAFPDRWATNQAARQPICIYNSIAKDGSRARQHKPFIFIA